MHNDEKPLVSICCITYNHGKFIADCLNGFLKQKTSFPFEIVVSNDCSTDDTKSIIDSYVKQYPKMIKDVSPEKNQGMMKNFYSTLMKCKGKYIAYCEGDDYWIDEKKLQMQVDFLEHNPDYGLCYTKSKKYIEKDKKIIRGDFGKKCCNPKKIINAYLIPTQTILFRNDCFCEYMNTVEPYKFNWRMGDLPLALWFGINSKIHFINKVTSIYRVLEKSANHHLDFNSSKVFLESSFEVKKYFFEKYMQNNRINMKKLQNILIYNLSTKAFVIGDYLNFKTNIESLPCYNIKIFFLKFISKTNSRFNFFRKIKGM